MKRQSVGLVVAVAAVILLVAGVTKVESASSFPEKGRFITVIVPFGAGGAGDIGARILAASLEKELGVPVQIVNRPGAAAQVGTTALVNSKPDGYTLGMTHLPATINIYLEPDRKATFGRKDLQPVALQVVDPYIVTVKTDSPHKSLKDLIDAAKSASKGITVGDSGLMGGDHLTVLRLGQLGGVKFQSVHFNSGQESLTALLGGHVDALATTAGQVLSPVKGGQVRVLAIMDKQDSPYYPGVQTAVVQGYDVSLAASRGVSAPAGTPKEILNALSAAIKKAMETKEHKAKMVDQGLVQLYMDPAQFEAYWSEVENLVKPLLDAAKKGL